MRTIMRLSMWMIANRLSSLDLELEIEKDAPAVLKSARRAYATNCVHVYEERNYVVCNGEGNIIRINNIGVKQAFEIIQDVFDFYEDWLERILKLVHKKDYQEVVNQSWMIFQNPMTIFDGNSKVIGISEQYSADSLDSEWEYLCKFGYPSINSIQHIRHNYKNIDLNKPGFWQFQFPGSSILVYDGVSYCMYCNEISCGRINVLEYERKLNKGDYQLLVALGRVLEPTLGQQYYETFFKNSNIFYSILFGKPYDEESLQLQLDYQQWKLEDKYQLALVRIIEKKGTRDVNAQADILLHTILRQSPNCVILKKSPYLIILSNAIMTQDSGMMSFLEKMAKNNSLQIGFSNYCQGLQHSAYLFEQGKAALDHGRRQDVKQIFYHFYDFAIDYIIATSPLVICTYACHQDVLGLWELKQDKDDEMFDTLKAYLDNERSIAKTAEALFTHRNTVVYRMKKIQGFLQNDLKDSYTREYLRVSIRVLELYDKRHTAT